MYKSKKIFRSLICCMITLALIIPNYMMTSYADNTALDAQDIVNDMSAGYNIGNAFDCYNDKGYNSEEVYSFKSNYQAMAIYSTKYYSGFDSSSCPYFSDGTCNLSWTISSLNSSLTGQCGSFGVQIINNSLKDSGTDTLSYSISNATFTKEDGTVISLDNLSGDYESVITNNVTSYARVDISSITELATSSDILGGTLSLSITINDYPLSTRTDLDSYIGSYYESLWGSPAITTEYIDAIADKGFNAIRLPITYRDHILSNGSIDPLFLARIKEVVDYIISKDMYCIINIHHDTGSNGWLRADMSSIDDNSTRLYSMWSQIASYFADYDYRLLYEGFNELLNSSNAWNYAGSDSYKATNILNQTFVDAVRASGGNNVDRCLIVNTYAASSEEDVIKNFVLPSDSVSDKLIVSIHSYCSESAIYYVFSRLSNYFTANDIPVIMGEFGITNTTSYDNTAYRISYINKYVSTARRYGITCFWWDDAGVFSSPSKVYNYSLLNRKTASWYFSDVADSLVASAIPVTFTDLSDIDFSDKNNWRSGCYSYTAAIYEKYASRICLYDFVSCKPSSTINISVSDDSYSILVRELDDNFVFLSTHIIADGESLTLSDNTSHLAISMYCPTDDAHTYNKYMASFDSGLDIDITYSNQTQDTVEGTPLLDTNSIDDWRTGYYNMNNGAYTTNKSRICLNDYLPCEPSTRYQVSFTDTNYTLLVRELDSDYNFISTRSLSYNDAFMTSKDAAYLGISLYRPAYNALTYNDYVSLFDNGMHISIIPTSYNDFSNGDIYSDSITDFISGCYYYSTGKYSVSPSKICMCENFVPADASTTYTYTCNNSSYNLLIRELDADYKFIATHDLVNGKSFTSNSSTSYFAISIYSHTSNTLIFNDYYSLFEEEDFYINLSK